MPESCYSFTTDFYSQLKAETGNRKRNGAKDFQKAEGYQMDILSLN